MTLYRQLVLAIVLIFAGLLAGTLLINLHNTRVFLEQQLASHAQDTATSLGLNLSTHLQRGDHAAMTAAVDSIFDRGYYETISVTTQAGEVLIERRLPIRVEGVPAWLVRSLPLRVSEASALLMSGWQQAGEVRVRSHPGHAYAQLWSNLTGLLGWFAGLSLLSLIVLALGVRLLLRPLRAVERQAEAIGAGRYDMLSTPPRTRELRRVVEAMNTMTDKVRGAFEAQSAAAENLRSLAFADALTGLGNRPYFDTQLQAQTSGEAPRGALLLLRLEGLQHLNDERGRLAGDALVKAAAQHIEAALARHGGGVPARLAGADFAVILEGADVQQAEAVAAMLLAELAALHRQGLAPGEQVAHAGGVLFGAGADLSRLLADADGALRAAQQSGPNDWRIATPGPSFAQDGHGREAWIKRLRAALASGEVVVHAQPARPLADPGRIQHYEILARLSGETGMLFSADKFMPLAEELELAKDIDRQVLRACAGAPAAAIPLAINLSLASLTDARCWPALFEAGAATGRGITFEVPESVAAWRLAELRAFAQAARAAGHAVALDQFGRGFGTFGYLHSLRPAYVKADGAYSRDIASDRDKQFYLRSLCDVCHSLDIPLIATRVERQEDWALLRELGVDGMQGNSAGEAAALSALK